MLKDHFDNTYSHVKGQHNTIMYLKKVTEENEMTRLQAERQAQEFQQQMAELQEENKRREQQIEEEKRAQQEREQRHEFEMRKLELETARMGKSDVDGSSSTLAKIPKLPILTF